MDVDKLSVVCCGGLEDDSFELGNTNVDVEFGVLASQIGFQPLKSVNLHLVTEPTEVV